MSEAKFTWEVTTEPAEWECLVEQSPQGTVFSERAYLDLIGRDCETYLVRKGSHCKAGVLVIPTVDGRGCELDDLVIHGGILFFPDETKKSVRQRFEQFELTDFIIAELDGRFNRMAFALAPAFEDLRPFLWHEFHNPDPAVHFTVDLRYTTYVDVSGLAAGDDEEATETFRAMDTLRQRHVRKARQNGATLREVAEGGRLIDYYRELMIRQGELPPDEKLQRMRHLTDGLVALGRGAIYEVVNQEGTVVYVAAYAWDTIDESVGASIGETRSVFSPRDLRTP